MCVCVCVCVCACVHGCVGVCVCAYAHGCMRACVWVCVQVYTLKYFDLCICSPMQIIIMPVLNNLAPRKLEHLNVATHSQPA